MVDTNGRDITGPILEYAQVYGFDPVVLLALLKAESGLNPRAERWGTRTAEARRMIQFGLLRSSRSLINDVWPDISFGFGQRIVKYHYIGDKTKSVTNILQVRQGVFNDPDRDIREAADHLAGAFEHSTCDGTPLSALVVYNAGSDRRHSEVWMRRWAGNVAAYEWALAWAEQYRR